MPAGQDSDCRLKAEWEVAAVKLPVKGNFVEEKNFHPVALNDDSNGLQQIYGDVWEWTQSAYLPYPVYKTLPGALGEYNGKFMSGQMVLRGGSCATSVTHIRNTYRNFFYPIQDGNLWVLDWQRMYNLYKNLKMKITTDRESHQQDILTEVIEGLNKFPKQLPSKLFYDEKGSQAI